MAADWRTSFSSYLGVHLALDRLHSISSASSPGSGCALTTCSVSVLSSAAKSLHNFFTKSACSYRQNVLWFHRQTPQRTHVLSSGPHDTAITGELRNLTQPSVTVNNRHTPLYKISQTNLATSTLPIEHL